MATACFRRRSARPASAAESDANDYLTYVHGTYGADVEEMIRQARDLFVRYGDEISAALLLSALPESYAAEWGAPVLIAHGDLVWQLPRRIRQTALFLLAVLTETDGRRHPAGVGCPARHARSQVREPPSGDQHRIDALPAVRLAASVPRGHPSGPRWRRNGHARERATEHRSFRAAEPGGPARHAAHVQRHDIPGPEGVRDHLEGRRP